MLLRCLVFSVLFWSVVCKKPSIELQRDKDNIPVFPNAQLTSVHQAETKKLSCPERRLAICSFDCTYIQFCVNGYISNTITIECPNGTLCDQNKHTPICSKNIQTCISTNITVKTDVQPTKCDKPKYTRDLEDCRKFTYCDTSGSYEYHCDNSTVFDENTLKCVKNLKCVSFSNKPKGLCFKKTENNYVSDPTNEKRYIKCTNPPRFIFCPDKYAFNQVKQGCEFKCLKEGRFKDPLDSTNRIFYECRKGSINGNDLFPIERKCPEGTAFNTRTGVCLLDNKIKVKSFTVNTTNSSIKTMSMTQQIICPQNYTYDLDSKKCEFTCKDEGNHPDFTDFTGIYYFECKKSADEFVSERKKCSEGLVFDFVTTVCINPFRNSEDVIPDEIINKNISDASKIAENHKPEESKTVEMKREESEKTEKKEVVETKIETSKVAEDKKEPEEAKNKMEEIKVIEEKHQESKKVEVKLVESKDDPMNIKDVNENPKETLKGVKENSKISDKKEKNKLEIEEMEEEITEKTVYQKPEEKEQKNLKDKLSSVKDKVNEFTDKIKLIQGELRKKNKPKPDDEADEEEITEQEYEEEDDMKEIRAIKNIFDLNKEIKKESYIKHIKKQSELKTSPEDKKMSSKNPQKSCNFENYVHNSKTNSCKFICPKEGSFPDFEDTSHEKYFECLLPSKEEGLIAVHRTCPEMTKFNVYSKLCIFSPPNVPVVLEFECKEGYEFNATSEKCQYKCKSEGLFRDVESDGFFYECIKGEVGEYLTVQKNCKEENIEICSAFEIMEAVEDQDVPVVFETDSCQFDCVNEGLFADPEDSTGSKYYECILENDKKFVAFCRNCPEMTSFHPIEKMCVLNSGNLELKCKEGFVFKKESQSCEVVCEEEGLFKDVDDLSGSYYYECSMDTLKDEILVVRKKCQDGEIFDEKERKCLKSNFGSNQMAEEVDRNDEALKEMNKNVEIPDAINTEESILPNPNTEDNQKTTVGNANTAQVLDLHISTTQTADPYVEVTKLVQSNANQNTKNVGIKNSDSEMIQISTSESTSDLSTKTKCNHINYIYVHEKDFCQFVCPTEGRFPDFLDTSGIKYYECISSADNPKNITANHLICPDGTVFNPRARICSFTDTKITTDPEKCPSGYKYVIDTFSCEFVCPEQGLFADSADPTKSHYYECICIHPGSKEVFPARKKCGGITTFDENKRVCKEPEETSADLISCSTGYKFNSIKQECEFDCKVEGKYLDPADTTGIYYFECVNEKDGGYSAQKRKCPEMTTFNHVVGICIFLIGNMNQIMNQSENETRFCKHKNYEFDPESGNCEFVCPDEGQFADYKDDTNVKYYECLKDAENGKILAVHRLCPEMTVFNSVAGVCSFLSPASICPKGFRFNLETQKCEFSCEKEGFFKDEADSLNVYYFECRKDMSTNKILATRLRCSLGEVFNLEQSKCVVKECEIAGFIYNAVKGMCVFKCPYEGRFPDLNDKKKFWYYECLKTGSEIVAFHKICPEETLFDPVIKICHFGQEETVSKSAVCFEGYKFDEARQVCEFHCEKEGRFVDWADATSAHYYECIKISRSKKQFTVIRRKCFGKTTFDFNTGICLSPLRRKKII